MERTRKITGPKTGDFLRERNALRRGGAEGNRTPVRKQLDGTFSGRSLLFTFPCRGVSKHTQRLGSFMMHGTGKAYCTHVYHSITPCPGSWSFRAGWAPN